jgi:hypothetical protein
LLFFLVKGIWSRKKDKNGYGRIRKRNTGDTQKNCFLPSCCGEHKASDAAGEGQSWVRHLYGANANNGAQVKRDGEGQSEVRHLYGANANN